MKIALLYFNKINNNIRYISIIIISNEIASIKKEKRSQKSKEKKTNNLFQ